MAIRITNIPVLTGEIAERFIAQCEYNARELRGTLWSEEREKRFLDFMEKNNRRLSEMKSKTQR